MKPYKRSLIIIISKRGVWIWIRQYLRRGGEGGGVFGGVYCLRKQMESALISITYIVGQCNRGLLIMFYR